MGNKRAIEPGDFISLSGPAIIRVETADPSGKTSETRTKIEITADPHVKIHHEQKRSRHGVAEVQGIDGDRLAIDGSCILEVVAVNNDMVKLRKKAGPATLTRASNREFSAVKAGSIKNQVEQLKEITGSVSPVR